MNGFLNQGVQEEITKERNAFGQKKLTQHE